MVISLEQLALQKISQKFEHNSINFNKNIYHKLLFYNSLAKYNAPSALGSIFTLPKKRFVTVYIWWYLGIC